MLESYLLFGLLFAAIVAILVYVDVNQRNLTNNPWIKSSTTWALAVFLLMIIFLPAYFVTRGPTKKELYVFQKKRCVLCDEEIDVFDEVCYKCGGRQH